MDKFMQYTQDQDGSRAEQLRLEGQHEVLLYHTNSKQIFAPLDFSQSGLRILDSGCANGRWLRDLQASSTASSTAEHEYVGTDIDEGLYPSPPPRGMRFQNQSIKEAFPSEWEGGFDLVNQRFVMAGVAPDPVAPVIQRLSKLLKPDGWLQLIEMDTEPEDVNNGPMLAQFIDMLHEMFGSLGLGNFGKQLPSLMKEAGLKDVQSEVVYVAHGACVGEKALVEKSIVSPVSAVAPVLQVFKNMPNSFSEQDLDDGYEGRLRKELEERGGHTKVVIAWGRK